MSSSAPDLEDADPRVNAALQEFLERKDRGEKIDLNHFVAKHPDIADRLRSFITGSEQVLRMLTSRSVATTDSTNNALSETVTPASLGDQMALPEVFGRYRVIRLLGRGAMGAVYLAQDTQLSRQVALKIPRFGEEQSEELLQRFYREARAAALLRSPHICPVYDVGEIEGQHYISMAFIEGRPLSEVLKPGRGRPIRQVLLLVRKLALGLQDAHDQGIVHRDLKPGNVMIDARGEPVVTDFGLACQIQEASTRLTHSGVILGTPAYMAPEQLEGQSAKITPAADQYSLGVMLYELLTGQLPFLGSFSAVISQTVTKPAPSPRLLRPELDPRVEGLCLQMLAKLPKERCDSMKAVADRLTAILKEPAKSEPELPVAPAAVAVPAEPASPKPGSGTPEPGSVAETTPPTRGSQQQVAALIQRGEYEAALEVLTPLAERKAGKLGEWAREQQKVVREQFSHWRKEIPGLCRLASKLIRKHDYTEAAKMLAAVPIGVRTEELSDLLREAEEKDDESKLLLKDIEKAIRLDQPQDLARLVKRFLQLKPGHKGIQALAAELKLYGAEKVIRLRRSRRHLFDAAGESWSRQSLAFWATALVAFCGFAFWIGSLLMVPKGTVVVAVQDPRLTVGFADASITSAVASKSFRLKTNETETLNVQLDGASIDEATQQISVVKNETKRITARLVDGQVQLTIVRDFPDERAPEKETVNVARAATPRADQLTAESTEAWIDILQDVDLATNGGRLWTRNASVLTGTLAESKTSGWVVLVPPQEIKGDYDLEVDYALFGAEYLQLGLPLDDTIATLSIGSQGTGLHWIDGNDLNASELKAPFGNPDLKVLPGVVQHVTVSVRHDGNKVNIDTTLDGETSGRYAGLRSRVTTPASTSPSPHHLKLVTQVVNNTSNTRIEVHKAWVRLIGASPKASDSFEIALFNGNDLTGWSPLDSSADDSRVEKGELVVKGVGQADTWLFTDRAFENFRLRFECQPIAGTNSGLWFRSQPIADKPQLFAEIDFSGPANPFVTAGTFYGVGPGMRNPRIGATSAKTRPAGEWNSVEVTLVNGRTSVYFNGQPIDYETALPNLDGPQHIGFQAFGGEARFRKIELEPLKPAAELLASTERVERPATSSNEPQGEVLLDVDFRKSNGGFALHDSDHILAEHTNGEYRYVGKLPGWYVGGLHPTLWSRENNQIENFVAEADVRIIGAKSGVFGIEFGRVGDDTVTVCLNQAGQFKLIRANNTDIVPFTASPAMRPVSQFNTVRVAVKDKLVTVSANGTQVFQKTLERYSGGAVAFWVGADEVPFDTRLQRFKLERIGSARPAPLTTEVRQLKGHDDVIRGVTFLPNSQQALSVGHNKAFKLWDVTTGEMLHDFVGHPQNVTSVSVSGDGNRALTGCDDALVRMWDLETRTLIRTLKGHVAPVVSVKISQDGLSGLTASNDGMIRRWSLKPGGKSVVVPGPSLEAILAVSPAEDVIASGHYDGSVILRSPNGAGSLVGHEPGLIEGLAFTPDGSKLVTGSNDGTVRVWDVQNGKQIHRFNGSGMAFDSVAVTQNGRYAFGGCGDFSIVGWDIESGERVCELRTDMPVMQRMALSPDNRYLLSGGGEWGWRSFMDFDLRLWNVPSPVAPAAPIDNAKLTPKIDADFSKGFQGFPSRDDNTFKAQRVGQEWQFMQKVPTWGIWSGGQPILETGNHGDFVFEADSRIDAGVVGGWGVCFGSLSNGDCFRFHVMTDGTVWIAQLDQGKWNDLLRSKPSSLRDVRQQNTVRLEVVDGRARIFTNGSAADECKLPRDPTGPMHLVLYPQDNTQPSVRFRRIQLWDASKASL